MRTPQLLLLGALAAGGGGVQAAPRPPAPGIPGAGPSSSNSADASAAAPELNARLWSFDRFAFAPEAPAAAAAAPGGAMWAATAGASAAGAESAATAAAAADDAWAALRAADLSHLLAPTPPPLGAPADRAARPSAGGGDGEEPRAWGRPQPPRPVSGQITTVCTVCLSFCCVSALWPRLTIT